MNKYFYLCGEEIKTVLFDNDNEAFLFGQKNNVKIYGEDGYVIYGICICR